MMRTCGKCVSFTRWGGEEGRRGGGGTHDIAEVRESHTSDAAGGKRESEFVFFSLNCNYVERTRKCVPALPRFPCSSH